jgi:hypothetical protein
MGKSVTLELPDSFVKPWKSDKDLGQEMREALVLDLVRKHKITWRQGAQFLGKRYKEFLRFMSENDVPVFDYEPGWLAKELETSRRLERSK